MKFPVDQPWLALKVKVQHFQYLKRSFYPQEALFDQKKWSSSEVIFCNKKAQITKSDSPHFDFMW